MSSPPSLPGADGPPPLGSPDKEALADLVQRLLTDQRRRWQAGESILVEAYLAQHPELPANPEAVLDLLYNEFVLRERRGESPLLQEYLERFPALAEDLAVLFEVDEGLRNELASVSPASQTTTYLVKDADTLPGGTSASVHIPGYEILRELGRGGMGVVYQARQRSLNRMVALKMVLGGSFASAGDLARFRAEAEVAAHLQHPNIVQVHEIGEHQGRPFFSLEFVEGGTLAERLKGVPQPPWPTAYFIETLARAVQYAHEHGIIHRDLKPANVLLESRVRGSSGSIKSNEKRVRITDYGLPKITDFGLAKWLDRDSQLTHSGDILGTPSYMAPEQASGRLQSIGPATDVYALGAILYQFLTGRPPFRGTTVAETLLQVQSVDPVAPRSLQPSVAADLETICLKCLEKEPAKRYASAEALADDLQRFQSGMPIEARPVSSLQRLVKWSRRNKAIAGLLVGGVTAVAVFIVLLVSWNISLTAANEREAKQHQESRRNLQRALENTDQMLRKVGEVDLENVPRMAPVRKELLTLAETSYQKIEQENGAEPAVRMGFARTRLGLGDVHAFYGELRDAERCFRDAIDRFAALAEEFPDQPEYRQNLGRANHGLSNLLRKHKQYDKAELCLNQALELRRQLVNQNNSNATYQREFASSMYFYGALLEDLSRKTEAEKAYRDCQTLQQDLIDKHRADADFFEFKGDLARTLNNLGRLLYSKNKYDPAAEQCFSDATAAQEKLAQHAPYVAVYRNQLARYYNNLAQLQSVKNLDHAVGSYRAAQKLWERLADDFPEVPDYRQDLAATYSNVGLLLQGLSRWQEAENALRTSVALRRKLDKLPDERYKLAVTLNNLVISLNMIGRTAEGIPCCREAIEIHQGVVKDHPQEPKYRSRLGSAYCSLGRLLQKDSLYPLQIARMVLAGSEGQPLATLTVLVQNHEKRCEARSLFDEAIAEHARRLDANPKSKDFREDLLLDHVLQLNLLLDMNDIKLAESYAEKAVQILANGIDVGFTTSAELQKSRYRSLWKQESFKTLRQRLENQSKRLAG